MSKNRTNPEQSLQHAKDAENKAKRGKLKIYLGAAPGVGKTYEMLHDAYESRAQNLDVVVGVVESHGREMIENSLHQFEIIPKKLIKYRDKSCAEFDLDAALKRNPGLILMDEMAHTNVLSMRHAKRWQDIKELLDRGINVYTTLNVQHIESLKDDVAQIIQAPIKETVPDFMIELADTIELVDLPVDELLKRLQEGKIYIPEQAELAVEHYFRKGNLIALRELALRTTAACVETEVLLYRKSEGIKYIWPTRDKILVCVGPNPESLKLIRTAKQLATSLQAEWIAVYIDVPRLRDSIQKRNQAIQHLRLAQQLGAETHVLIGSDLVNEIIQFALESNITQIMVWKNASRHLRYFFRRHLADDILAHCGEINVYIVTGHGSRERAKKFPIPHLIPWGSYVLSLGVPSLATFINHVLYRYLDSSNLIMVYFLGAIAVALLGDIAPAILASLTSILAFDFFFLEPYDSFKMTDYRHMVTLGMMFFVMQVIVYFTLLKHRKAQMANQIQRQTEALYAFSRKLLLSRSSDELLALGNAYIADIFKADVVAFLPNHHQLEMRENNLFKPIVDEKERSVAEWVYEMGQSAGHGTDTLASSDALYLPLLSSESAIGVLKVRPKNHILYTPEQMRLLESCVNQLTLALEVDRLQEKNRKKELKVKVDTARNMLLKNISDHFNFPLQVILTAIRSPKDQKNVIDSSTINDELSRISLINNNILQIISFDTESILLNKHKLSLAKLIRSSINLFHKRYKDKSVNLKSPKRIPSILGDGDLLQEVFENLLDNANKFSPPETGIDVVVQPQSGYIQISIENVGDEISEEEINHLFKKFYSGKKPSSEQGLGLGLAICQKIIEAHNGKIWPENIRQRRAVVFHFTLPHSE